jgi:hypothetical protein
MKILRILMISATIAGFVASALLLPGCKKDKADTSTPTLPPQSGFVMSFSDFANSGDTLKSTTGVTTYNNWGYSYFNVVGWNIALTVGLAIPVASYTEAFKHEAVYHSDAANWTWSYNFNVGNIPYGAELTGTIVSDSVSWEMRITKGMEFNSFLWYSGKSSRSGTGGYWILKENPAVPNNILKIDWNKHADNTADIRYTNIKSGTAEKGSYIFYGTTLNTSDRFYNIYNKGLNNLTLIEWSSLLKNGHVKDLHQYQNDNWHCWDSNLLDIVCP